MRRLDESSSHELSVIRGGMGSSTTQVRKGIYKDSLKAWLRYEKQLQPLVKLLGDLVDYDLKTSLPGYIQPQTEEPNE